MRICILTPRFPFPENGGDVLRINHIARYLKSRGHELVLVSFCESRGCDKKAAQELYDKVYVVRRHALVSLCFSLLFWLAGKPIQCGYYYSPFFRRKFREVVRAERPGLYVAHLLRMVPYLEQLRLQGSSVVEMTDALSKTYSMSAGAKGGMLKRMVYGVEQRLIGRFEHHVVRTFPKVVLVSRSDMDFLKTSCRADFSSLALHTNGVDCAVPVSSGYKASKLCFIGNMRTLQNQDAVLHFADDIFPLILKRIPDAVFYVVGAEPPRRILELAEREHIVVTGFVDDLGAVISDACLAVAPVRVAAGIQNKVLVAMAAGLPVVMTSMISQAIPELCHGENCLIHDDAESFAGACVRVMGDESFRGMLSVRGREMVRSHYSWEEKLRGYEVLSHGEVDG